MSGKEERFDNIYINERVYRHVEFVLPPINAHLSAQQIKVKIF